MITIWVKKDENTWELVEELQDDLALAQRLIELRKDGLKVVRVERKNSLGSEILDV